MKENKHKKHDRKRKRMKITLNEEELKKMEEKFGFILDAGQAKEMILLDSVTRRIVHTDKTPFDEDLMNRLRKIGEEFNQMTYEANRDNNLPPEILIHRKLFELKKILKEIENRSIKFNG